MSTAIGPSRAELRAELESTRREFHALLAGLSQDDWERPSRNPAWTNGQLLVHVTFAFLLVPRLWRIMQLFGRLPRSWSRAFASLLDVSTPFFHHVNAVLPRVGARFVDRPALGAHYDRVHARILARLSAIRPDDWSRGMCYPTRWDPRFTEYMTFADLPRWAVVHYRHHLAQLVVERNEGGGGRSSA